MKRAAIVDAGPLVACLNRRDAYHAWAREQFAVVPPPLVTCDAVLAEACYLLRDTAEGGRAVVELLERGVLTSDFRVERHAGSLMALMAKYSGVPMSLADACLVRLSELHDGATVITLDGDFLVYRRHGRQVIPVRMPEDRR